MQLRAMERRLGRLVGISKTGGYFVYVFRATSDITPRQIKALNNERPWLDGMDLATPLGKQLHPCNARRSVIGQSTCVMGRVIACHRRR